MKIIRDKAVLKIILISQWPGVKNAEYELINKIQQSDIETVVLDNMGFDVSTGEYKNNSSLVQEFDFAISFHYDTPCWLNIPTVHWLANPREFMLLRHDYAQIRNRLKSYRYFVDNGSEDLVEHLRHILGEAQLKIVGQFYPSVSKNEITHPAKLEEKDKESYDKLFYCGINWEKGAGKSGREESFFKKLDQSNRTNFFGPLWFEGFQPWGGFKNYQGEIPFDGYSLGAKISNHLASICLSSPAHIKSNTSSSRVFETIAAGVPAISDMNNHVKKLFGDSIYYFNGASSPENIQQVEALQNDIYQNYEEATAKVLEAQKLLKNKYSFETCISNIKINLDEMAGVQTSLSLDLFFIVPAAKILNFELTLDSAACLANAIEYTRANSNIDISLNLLADVTADMLKNLLGVFTNRGITANVLDFNQIVMTDLNSVKLGDVLLNYGAGSAADLISIVEHDSFVFYDHFINAATWFEQSINDDRRLLYLAGSYCIDLETKTVKQNNTPNHEYIWSAQSAFEHELSTLVFHRSFFEYEFSHLLRRFDCLLPIAAVLLCMRNSGGYFRSSKFTIRRVAPSFNESLAAYQKAAETGFWDLHYNMKSNYEHEYNMLLDCAGDDEYLFKIVSVISNKHWLLGTQGDIDVELKHKIDRIARLVDVILPLYRFLKKLKIRLLSIIR